MIVVIYKGKGREGTKQVPFTSKALAIKKAKDLYKKGYCNVKLSEISEKILFIPGRTIWLEYSYLLKAMAWICVNEESGEFICEAKTLKEIEEILIKN